MKFSRRFCCTVVCGMLMAHASADETVVDYEPHRVTVAGILVERTFPGPPNYESVAAGDRAEKAWILRLATPVTVRGDPASDINRTTETTVRELQVYCAEKIRLQGKFLEQTVTITGTLFHGHTGHHRTDVVLRALEIRSASEVWREEKPRER